MTGAAYLQHSDWAQPKFFLGCDEEEAYQMAVAYLFEQTKADRAEFERTNGPISDDAWLEALIDTNWDLDFGSIVEKYS